LGFKNREVFHNTDWSSQNAAPKKNEKMVGDWLILHDPEKYTHDNYHKAAEHLLTGAPFENTNIPPGYKYKPWTVRELWRLQTTVRWWRTRVFGFRVGISSS
jgi:hypothetical protein